MSLLEKGSKQIKFHIVNLDVDVVIPNKKVKQVQLEVVPDIWLSGGICYYPNSKNFLPYVMRRSPVGKKLEKISINHQVNIW